MAMYQSKEDITALIRIIILMSKFNLAILTERERDRLNSNENAVEHTYVHLLHVKAYGI